MDGDWIAADLEILDSISHCDETFMTAKKPKSHKEEQSIKKEQQGINHQISIIPEDLQLIVKLIREFLEKIGIELPKNFLEDNSKSLSELIL